MKIRNVILLSIFFSIILVFINLNSILWSHEFYYIALPFLIDPIAHFASYIGWLRNITPEMWPFYGLYAWPPVFWPLIVCLLIFIKNKLAPYIILGLVYLLIILTASYRLINEPDMIGNTFHSMAIYIEPIGILVFVLGQVGIFYILKLKKEGRLY